MQLRTRGIVLQSTDYGETSLVVKIYTETSGMTSFIVSGVRTRNPKFAVSLFQPFTLTELIASGKPGQSLLRITDIRLAPPLNGIPGDMVKSSIALFLAEVVYRSIREETPNPALYGFLFHGIQVLDVSGSDCTRFHLYFLARLTRHLGFFPNGDFTAGVSIFDLREGLFRSEPPLHREYFSPSTTVKLHQLLHTTFESYNSIDITHGEMKELLKGLVFYFELHQTHGSIIRSHKVLEEILN
jgi:DNA repair protein RecO (recombination protein O)